MALLGKMFKVKLDLPEWKSDEDIARHLLKLVFENTFNPHMYVCIIMYFCRDLVCVHLSKDIDKFHFLM